VTVAGRTVMALALTDKGTTIRCWRRSGKGEWSGPVQVVQEKSPVYAMPGGQRVSFVAQTYSPPNFVPIAWTVEGQRSIKILRVPVPAE
jgi:hypothetical protein